jgi:hypothetical protein
VTKNKSKGSNYENSENKIIEMGCSTLYNILFTDEDYMGPRRRGWRASCV